MEFPQNITIKSHTIQITPRYSETDKAGVVHNSVYPIWFEMGRTELLRVNGLAYKDLEEAGVFFVVAELHIKYRRGAYYDEQLELTTTCTSVTPARIEHSYRLSRCSNDEIVAEGSTILAHVDSQGKAQRIPEFMYCESVSRCR